MKTFTLLWLFLCAVILNAQELSITVSNPASFDRPNETIEVPWIDIQQSFPDATPASIGVFEGDRQLVHQDVDLDANGVPEMLLFQSGFSKGEAKQFILRKTDTQPETKAVTMAQFMVPREDVAWENDKIAYRIYGSSRAGDVRSGLDVLVKRVPYPVLDKWYAADSLKGSARISYHVDHGEGADFFSVGKSMGGGGSCLMIGDSMLLSGLFTSHSIVANGPIRAIFKVWYERDTLDGQPFMEEKTYTLDAGDNLNKIEIAYTGLPNNGAADVAIGLVKRKNVTFSSDAKEQWFSLWGLANDDSANGYLSTGVVIPGNTYQTTKETADHFLMMVKTSPDKRVTYYAGGGWSRGGVFAEEKDWQSYLSMYAQRLRFPLNISYTLKGR